jgi:hypothetical protein
MYKLQKAHFDQEINTAVSGNGKWNTVRIRSLFFAQQKAESQLAYELQAAKIRQRIRNEEIQIDVVERKKLTEIETQEITRKDRELTATVKLPAEAESYRVQAIAEGKRTQTIQCAVAESERIKKIGLAEAQAIEMVGKAEAERMRMKAAVYKQYGDAAIMNIVLEALPKVGPIKSEVRVLEHNQTCFVCFSDCGRNSGSARQNRRNRSDWWQRQHHGRNCTSGRSNSTGRQRTDRCRSVQGFRKDSGRQTSGIIDPIQHLTFERRW